MHQSLVRCFVSKNWFVVYSRRNILTKLVGYPQSTCLCVRMEFVIEFGLYVNFFTFIQLFSFMWGR